MLITKQTIKKILNKH
uniref:Uncharacterized protein n=1 Tax=Arundo donax TaxID=35708 RepID=A0A0A9A773_ARUDO